SCISNVSLFSLDDIDTGNSGGGSGCPGGGNVLQGEDLAYGDWQNDFNPTARGTTMAGIGTPESITGGSEVAGRDYDSGTGFVRDNPTDGQITFPFDVEAQTGQQDQDRMDFLRDEAKANGLYYTSSGGKVDAGSDFAWPANSTHTTVVFVEYTGASGTNRVEWKVGSDSDPPVKGTLVVNGGNFKMTQNRACLQGVAIVRGGIYEEGESDNVGGNTCLDGFVNASGTIKINGSPEPLASDEVLNRPGFYGVRLWSWREVYSAA
ncbi:MAG: hypothetical protein ACRDSJ_22655, partial [Rubrobacteraceae bacterium]